MLYTAKGTGALLVPLFTGFAKTHGWSGVFSFFVTFSIVAGLLALFVLKPMRNKHFAKSRAEYPSSTAGVTAGPRTS
jgi:OFA family oxalate/formate antiporter-like MFS transporter